MAKRSVEFNSKFFEDLGKSEGLARLTKESAQRVLQVAQDNAPVDSGDYRNGLEVVEAERPGRRVYLVQGTDPKTILVEIKTGNLARALRQVGRK